MWLLEHINKRPDEAIQKAIDKAVDDAENKWGISFEGEYPRNGIGISTLRAFHVEGNSLPFATANQWRVAITAANTWQNWTNASLNENLYVIHAGVFNTTANPSFDECAFKANGQDLPVQCIESMYTYEKPLAWWSKPFIVAAENNLTGRIKGRAIQTDDAGYLGFTVAKRLILIDES